MLIPRVKKIISTLILRALHEYHTKKGLKLLILDEDNNTCKETTNVVYRKVYSKSMIIGYVLELLLL